MYFLDDRAFLEPEAFWIGGARSSTVVIQPVTGRSGARCSCGMRRWTITSRSSPPRWRDEMSPWHRAKSAASRCPIDRQRGAALLTVTASAGFRPSAVDPKSRDDRFLGV